MTFNLSFAVESEFDEVYDLYTQVCKKLETSPFSPHWEIDYYPNREDTLNLIERKELLVCKAGKRIVAAVAVYCGQKFTDGEQHWGEPGENQSGIRLFAVHPEYRGMGISDKMLTFAKEITKARGHKDLVLLVAKGNTPAEELYKRNGFEFICETIFMDTPEIGNYYFAYSYRV